LVTKKLDNANSPPYGQYASKSAVYDLSVSDLIRKKTIVKRITD
jgi:hypothetical protein